MCSCCYCTVKVAVAEIVGLVVLVAVIVTGAAGATAGAVYRPLALIVPPPVTDQVTVLGMYQPTA